MLFNPTRQVVLPPSCQSSSSSSSTTTTTESIPSSHKTRSGVCFADQNYTTPGKGKEKKSLVNKKKKRQGTPFRPAYDDIILPSPSDEEWVIAQLIEWDDIYSDLKTKTPPTLYIYTIYMCLHFPLSMPASVSTTMLFASSMLCFVLCSVFQLFHISYCLGPEYNTKIFLLIYENTQRTTGQWYAMMPLWTNHNTSIMHWFSSHLVCCWQELKTIHRSDPIRPFYYNWSSALLSLSLFRWVLVVDWSSPSPCSFPAREISIRSKSSSSSASVRRSRIANPPAHRYTQQRKQRVNIQQIAVQNECFYMVEVSPHA